jgi:hypothetical protein
MSLAAAQTTLSVTNLASVGGSSVVLADPTGYDLSATVITVPANSTVTTQVSPDYIVNVTPQLLDLTSRGLITYTGGTGSSVTLYTTLVNFGTGSTPGVISFVPGFSGRIVSAQAEVDVAGTGTGASVPLQLFVTPSGGSATPCTGGALHLTLANTATVLTEVSSTPVTAGGSFGPADTIGFNQAASTVFTAGKVNLVISLSTI